MNVVSHFGDLSQGLQDPCMISNVFLAFTKTQLQILLISQLSLRGEEYKRMCILKVLELIGDYDP